MVSRSFLTVALFGGLLVAVGMHQSATSLASALDHAFPPRHGRNSIAERDTGTVSGQLQEELRRMAMGIDRAARGRAPETVLRALDATVVDLPVALPLYRDEVARYAEDPFAPELDVGQLEQMGFPLLVAGVAWLQECDYAGQSGCVAAARVQELLASVTGVEGLSVVAPVGEPDEGTIRRFRAVASAWKRLLERHARDLATYRGLLVMTRKAKSEERKD